MRRFWAAFGSLLFFVIAPGTIVGLVPWSITDWQLRPAFFGFEALRLAGAALMLLGLILLVESFARFVWKGFGTPAPIAPPTKLVMTGFYRRVRNPIYVGLVTIVFGEALILGDNRGRAGDASRHRLLRRRAVAADRRRRSGQIEARD